MAASASAINIQVAVGIVCNSDGEVLIAKRPNYIDPVNCWEFPGGKIEEGEAPLDALCRELKEEVDIDATKTEYFLNHSHEYNGRRIDLRVYIVTAFSGCPRGAEGQEIKWVPIKRLPEIPFLKGNGPIVTQFCIKAAESSA